MNVTFECISDECLLLTFDDGEVFGELINGPEFSVEDYILGDNVTCPYCGKTFSTDYHYGWGFADFWLVEEVKVCCV